MKTLKLVLDRGRLTLQELGPSLGLLTLPGGYVVAVTGWIYRHWPSLTRRDAE